MRRALDGKVVAVTGGSRDIGRAIVRDAAEHGARVTYCAREPNLSFDTPRSNDNAPLVFGADISYEDDVSAFFDAILRTYGRLDGVIHNAGIAHSQFLVNTPLEMWDQIIETNLTGAFLVIREALRIFINQAEGGCIVNIGSLAQFGMQADACYAVSKAGLWGLTRFIAENYGQQRIRANQLAVGYIETDLTTNSAATLKLATIRASTLKRVGQLHEVASAARFLASDDAAAINGEMVFVSGGLHEAPLYR